VAGVRIADVDGGVLAEAVGTVDAAGKVVDTADSAKFAEVAHAVDWPD